MGKVKTARVLERQLGATARRERKDAKNERRERRRSIAGREVGKYAA